MYVCICNQVTDSQIRTAVAEGARSMRDLQRQLGLATTCGTCAPCAHELLVSYLNEAERPPAMPNVVFAPAS